MSRYLPGDTLTSVADLPLLIYYRLLFRGLASFGSGGHAVPTRTAILLGPGKHFGC